MATFRSFAKLNLSLAVTGRRPDGYHELRTVFQTIDLGDEIEIEPRAAPGVGLDVVGAALPADERNLALRAARLFLEERTDGSVGVAIRLVKGIPVAAGLGGGSADAAGVLLGLGTLLGMPPRQWLRDAAARLGADVPFFLVGGTALGTGRGDVVRPLPDAPAPTGDLVLLLPRVGLSTAEVFGELAAERERLPDAVRAGSASTPTAGDRLADWIGDNDLEPVAFRLRPELSALYTAAVRSGARRVRMSGSGSTLFALYDRPGAAEASARFWPAEIDWKRVATLGRAAWRSAGGWAAVEGD